ncbi:MAG: potassium-transporting ATPase subunit KdpA [Alphaproteobacteria bacterium]|nr:potassium-transporting ATPase subunit KdpA [Alphaproteobacteria bacterium]
MTGNSLLQILVFLLVLFLLVKPVGLYMARVYAGEKFLPVKLLGWLEWLCYAAAGVDPHKEMTWRQYAVAFLTFNLAGFLLLFVLLLLQGMLPLNPQGFGGVSPDLAFNIAVSFITNTNWQSYSGETTLSNFSQIVGLTVQNFLSAAAGMSVLVALVRGFTRKNTDRIGNFWADMLRTNLYILLPLSLILAVALGSQGVVQSMAAYAEVPLVEPAQAPEQKDDAGNVTQKAETVTKQQLPLGLAASQTAIQQLGTNGGGLYNANLAHPFANPTPLSGFMQMLAILLIPAALCCTFGKMAGDIRQGWAVLIAMTVIYVPVLFFCLHYEQNGNPLLSALGVDQHYTALQPGGNMEGKETRFGIVNSVIWATATTAASNGSVNSMLDSFTPLGGLAPMLLMHFGEVVYGGVGSGLYGMLIYVLVSVFIAGLMVGRTPEYLGKKIQAFEMKMASVVILIAPLAVLVGTAVAVLTKAGQAGIMNPGPQGFSEVMYAFTSASNNNGSAFAGLNANTVFYNTALGLCMLIGRFWVIVPVLAIAGSLAAKNHIPPSNGTLPTHTPLFISVLVGTVVLVGVLTYVPSLALGPAAEYFSLLK